MLTQSELPALILDIQRNDSQSIATLYCSLGSFRKVLICKLGDDDGQDCFHAGFLATLEAIQSGNLREPEKFFGLAKTIFYRSYCKAISARVTQRNSHTALDVWTSLEDTGSSPFELLQQKQRIELMREALSRLSSTQREILTRHYTNCESKESICKAMGLTETQFRVNKGRAKAALRKQTGRQQTSMSLTRLAAACA